MNRTIEKKTPSDRQLAARQSNAARIAARISDLLVSGHRVYDEAGDQVLKTVIDDGGDVLFEFRDGGNTIMFMNDKEYDNGALESIPEFNASFAGWTFLHPKNIKPLQI